MRSSWILRASACAERTSSSRPTPTSDSNPRPISPTTTSSTVTAAVSTLLTTARTCTSSPAAIIRQGGVPPLQGTGHGYDRPAPRGARGRRTVLFANLWCTDGRWLLSPSAAVGGRGGAHALVSGAAA